MELDPNSTRNHTAFFHTKYDRASRLRREGNLAVADEICRELIGNFACPRMLQVRAWQIRSLCTNNFFEAQSHLKEVFSLLDRVPVDCQLGNSSDDPTWRAMDEDRSHTLMMLQELESTWDAQWKAIGKKAPLGIEEARAMEAKRLKEEAEKTAAMTEEALNARKTDADAKEMERRLDELALHPPDGRKDAIMKDVTMKDADTVERQQSPEYVANLRGFPWAGGYPMTPPASSPHQGPVDPRSSPPPVPELGSTPRPPKRKNDDEPMSPD